jgi:hypothetical protein
MRVDDAHHILGLRLNDWTAMVVFLLAVVYIVISSRLRPGREEIVEPRADEDAPAAGDESVATEGAADKSEGTSDAGTAGKGDAEDKAEAKGKDEDKAEGGTGDGSVDLGKESVSESTATADSATTADSAGPASAPESEEDPEDGSGSVARDEAGSAKKG